MTAKTVPSTGAALSALARLTLMRLFRGKLIWVSLGIAFLPLLLAVGARQSPDTAVQIVFGVEIFVLAILPPMFAAPAIGEELEDRTATYLWSRPLERWTILVGKLIGLVPFVVGLVLAGFVVGVFVATRGLPPVLPAVAIVAGALGTSIVSAGIAMLAPKRGMAFAIIYILILDVPVGSIPASVQWLSVTHATSVLSGLDSSSSPAAGAIALLALSAVWLAVAFRRIGRLET